MPGVRTVQGFLSNSGSLYACVSDSAVKLLKTNLLSVNPFSLQNSHSSPLVDLVNMTGTKKEFR